MKKLLLLSTLTLLPTLASAQIFRIERVSNNGAANAAIDAELVNIQARLNQDLPSGDRDRLMEGMANSQAASGKGLATDYISHFDTFAVGVGVGLAADLREDKDTESDLSGIGVSAGLNFGINIGAITDNEILWMDPKKLTLMVNFFKYNIDQKFDDSSVEADTLSFGFMGTYKWKDGNGSRMFGWDGVRLHAGYQYSKNSYGFSSTFNETIDENIGGPAGDLQGNILANPSAGIDVTSHSIPLEISSGINFLYILSFYGGVGTDINFGSAEGRGNLNAEDSTLTCTGACGGNVIVRVSGDLDNNGSVKPLFLRGFAGFQVNLPYARVYVHANKIFGTEVYSVATGLRLAF